MFQCRLVTTALLVLGVTATSLAEPAPPRPNIVFVLLDDLRWDEIGCMGHPFARTPNIDRLAREGLLCRNAFAVTPLCSPSRASFLTGLYPHDHGIVDNVDRSPESHKLVTFPRLLHDAGYETAFVGKWHMGVDDSPRPGFDYWLSVKGQGEYTDPQLNENGQPIQVRGYVTDIFNQRAVSFLKRSHENPFLLYLSHKAVHPDVVQRADASISDPSASKFVPAERHRTLYADQIPPRRPNAFIPPTDKPALMRQIDKLPPLGRETATSDETMRNRLRMLASVDEGLGEILETLAATGQLDRTLIIFTSDHGYFYGEHGLSVERRLAYEEAIRIPLVMRCPSLIKPGGETDDFILSIDLAPTLLELGGATIPKHLAGRSQLPLLSGQPHSPRESFLIEHFSDNVFPRVRNLGYQAVRNHRWKLIRYRDLQGMDELYDLASDPYELRNLLGNPSAQGEQAKLAAELDSLLDATAVKAPRSK